MPANRSEVDYDVISEEVSEIPDEVAEKAEEKVTELKQYLSDCWLGVRNVSPGRTAKDVVFGAGRSARMGAAIAHLKGKVHRPTWLGMAGSVIGSVVSSVATQSCGSGGK